MLKNTFYRNIRAQGLLDSFLISAIASLLLVRFYLHVTGYPQIGGGSLHIAHMLYGGILMMAAIVVNLAFIGLRSRQLAAVVGGAGFGIFIDELGKFITKDNDYFFQPTIGLIYGIFIILYLLFNFLTRSQAFTSREYHLNVLAELEEAIEHDMDKTEKKRLYSLLDSSDKNSRVTKHLRDFIDRLQVTASVKPSKIRAFSKQIDKLYMKFWRQRNSKKLVGIFFAGVAIVIAAGAVYTIYESIEDIKALLNGPPTYAQELLIGQVLSSVAAGGFVAYGLYALRKSRVRAFEQFRRAVLINIYLVQFFVFIRFEFEALPGFILNLILLIFITFVLRQETRLGDGDAKR